MGEFQYISVDGEDREISLAKDIGVVAVLTMSKDFSCSRSRIIDLLWSDRCDEQGRASLRHSLWSLKKILNRNSVDLLQTDRKRVSLNPDLCSFDWYEFLQLGESTELVDLERAISLCRGELLEGLVIRDAEWEEWLGLERERLQLKYAEILFALSEHYFAEGDARNLIHTGRRLIDHNPLCEEGHRALMGGYSMDHQKSLALKQYERYRDIIRTELNSNPEPRIREFYESIRNGEIDTGIWAVPSWAS